MALRPHLTMGLLLSQVDFIFYFSILNILHFFSLVKAFCRYNTNLHSKLNRSARRRRRKHTKQYVEGVRDEANAVSV